MHVPLLPLASSDGAVLKIGDTKLADKPCQSVRLSSYQRFASTTRPCVAATFPYTVSSFCSTIQYSRLLPRSSSTSNQTFRCILVLFTAKLNSPEQQYCQHSDQQCGATCFTPSWNLIMSVVKIENHRTCHPSIKMEGCQLLAE